MYKVYFADLGKATGIKEIGKRPVVSVGLIDGKAKVYKITSRNREDYKHIRMNTYIISGYCDISKFYLIDKKYLISYQRDCTKSEIEAIDKYAKK